MIFKSWLYFTDSITDRPTNPYGFLVYTASFESIFLPIEGPFLKVWNTFINVKNVRWEGYGYVGFVGLLTLILAVIRVGRYALKKRVKRILGFTLPSTLKYSLWTSVLLLFFFMSFHIDPNLKYCGHPQPINARLYCPLCTDGLSHFKKNPLAGLVRDYCRYYHWLFISPASSFRGALWAVLHVFRTCIMVPDSTFL